MEELRVILQQMVQSGFVQAVLSNTKDAEQGTKVKIRPVRIGENLLFQETKYRNNQVFHENLKGDEMVEHVLSYLQNLFKQGEFHSETMDVIALVSKKGKVTIKKKQVSGACAIPWKEPDYSHNRTKKYLLPEGEIVDFMVELGIQTPEGKITKARYDKFRQINRYLEFIDDVLDKLPVDRRIRIIDFGCGKSYLTFAMYYYLHQIKNRDIEVTGLDLKKDVIRHCNELAEKLGYEHLHFEMGDISTYEGADAVDMVVSLHACDVATDYALEKAVRWNASVIMAVPCCQHELNRQMKANELKSIFKYGIIKERIAALVTDALRAELLEQQGYDTQILEFIDMEHTPKNLLIRAVKGSGMRAPRSGNLEQTIDYLHVAPTLERLLKESE